MNAIQVKNLKDYIVTLNNETKHAQSVMDRGASLASLVWSLTALNGQLSFLSGLYVATLTSGIKPNRTDEERAADQAVSDAVRLALKNANQMYAAMQERISVLLEKVEA